MIKSGGHIVMSGLGLLVAFCCSAAWADVVPPNADRLAEVKAGRLDAARADWWGFDPEDATSMLQMAVTSGVRKLIIPNLGSPWIVNPVRLSSNVEIDVEPGTVVEAIRGGFKDPTDSLFKASATGTHRIALDPGNSMGWVAGEAKKPDAVSLDDAVAAPKIISLYAHERPFHFLGTQALFYFHVPAGVREFYVLAAGSGAERVKATLYNAQSEVVEVADNVSLAKRMFVNRDDASRGEVWMLQTSMPGQSGIEDYEIDLFGVPPILSTTREGLYGE